MDNDQDRFEYEVQREEYEQAQVDQAELNKAAADAILALLTMLDNQTLMEAK